MLFSNLNKSKVLLDLLTFKKVTRWTNPPLSYYSIPRRFTNTAKRFRYPSKMGNNLENGISPRKVPVTQNY